MEGLLFELFVAITVMTNVALMMLMVIIPIILVSKIGTHIVTYVYDVIKHSRRNSRSVL